VVGAERFLAEIKTTANLQHPHILPLFDSGEADGFLFYVMPYVEGESLRDRLDREKQLPVDEAVRIATNVAEALEHAHSRGVIHRDVKPENILLQAGKPVVSDFGIALAVGTAGGGRLTGTGMSLGTPHYMSPEQATGDVGLGPGTDVYALGCVLYETLVGEPPYTGSTPQAILGKIIQAEPVSATKARSTVPAHVDAAIRRALEKVPADRFTSAHDFATAIADASFRHGEDVGAAGAGVAGAGPWKRLAMALTASTAVFAVVAAWSFLRPAPSQPVTRQVLSSEGWLGLDGPVVGHSVALAPDGSSMTVPIESPTGEVQLGLKMRDATAITPIPGTEEARGVVYSPDGGWIAYAIGADLYKRPLIGGSAVKLAEDVLGGGGFAIAWLDGGTILYVSDSERIQVIPQDGGEPLRAVRLSPRWMQGLPGASGALLVNSSDELLVVDLEDLSSEVVLTEVRRAWYAPTGHVVYVRRDGAVFAQPFDLGSLSVTGGAVPLFDRVRTSLFNADMHLAADGTLLYVEGTTTEEPQSQLTVVDLEGNAEALALAPRPIGELGVGWSSDGASVVFRSGWQIYTYNTVLNTTPRRLTPEGTAYIAVSSPDGTRVALTWRRDGTEGWDLFTKDVNDDAPPRSIVTLDGSPTVMGWPADTLIVFENWFGLKPDLWMVDISDPDNPEARPYLTSEASLSRITISPDGMLAAYRSDESGTVRIHVRSFPTPGERTVVYSGAAGGLAWSPDGRTLYAFTEGSERYAIAIRLQRDPVPAVLSVDTLFPMPVGALEPQPGSVLHPDGDRFILALPAGVPEAEGTPRPDRLILVTNFFEELRQRTGGDR
jgi:serine/threonine-protein kinase